MADVGAAAASPNRFFMGVGLRDLRNKFGNQDMPGGYQHADTACPLALLTAQTAPEQRFDLIHRGGDHAVHHPVDPLPPSASHQEDRSPPG